MKSKLIEVYLALGSNLGDRLLFLDRAIELLGKKITDMQLSPVYETVPWGVKEQPMFLNLCLGGRTSLSANELLVFVKSIEKKLNRSVQIKWGPREIDIDILFYGHEIIHKPDLVIPHAYLSERAFALVPLADIAPDFVHPELKYTVEQLKQNVDTSTVQVFTGH